MNEEEKLFCEKCNYSTIRSDNFKRHQLSKRHNSTLKQTNKCELCSKQYKYNSGLWRHRKNCKGETSIKELQDQIQKQENFFMNLLDKMKEEMENSKTTKKKQWKFSKLFR